MDVTLKLGHDPIPMKMVRGEIKGETSVEFFLMDKPGHFYWDVRGGKRTLVVMIPNNTKRGCVYSRWTIDFKNSNGDQWSWDGNEAEPTLTPSLHAVGIWHGWVRSGMLVEN